PQDAAHGPAGLAAVGDPARSGALPAPDARQRAPGWCEDRLLREGPVPACRHPLRALSRGGSHRSARQDGALGHRHRHHVPQSHGDHAQRRRAGFGLTLDLGRRGAARAGLGFTRARVRTASAGTCKLAPFLRRPKGGWALAGVRKGARAVLRYYLPILFVAVIAQILLAGERIFGIKEGAKLDHHKTLDPHRALWFILTEPAPFPSLFPPLLSPPP